LRRISPTILVLATVKEEFGPYRASNLIVGS
jgi:hypothetical protein